MVDFVLDESRKMKNGPIVSGPEDPVEHRTLEIDGMSCGHCVARVGKTLAALPGVSVEDVQVGSARIEFDPSRLSLQQIGQALDDVGFNLRLEHPTA